MSTEHRTIRESLGAYVLGHLDDDEVVALHAHLDGCAECRAEVAELETVVPALRGVDPSALDATPTPPPDLGDRILEQARAEGRPRARRGAMLVAAGAVAIALAGGVGYLLGAGTGATPAVPREVVEVRAMAPGVQASAVAIPHTWGVEITLDADGFATGQVYRVVVRDDAGRAVSAGEFVGTGDAGMRCNLNSSVLRADASGFDVLDGQGAVVVHGDL